MMDREKDGKGLGSERAHSQKHISMELTADGARVTSLSLKGTRLVLTIEAELSDSLVNTGADVLSETGGDREETADIFHPKTTDTQVIAGGREEDSSSPGLEDVPEPQSGEDSHATHLPEPSSPDPVLFVDTSMMAAADVHSDSFAGEEDVMGGLPLDIHQAAGDSGAAALDGTEPVPPIVPSPIPPPAPQEPKPVARPGATSRHDRESHTRTISLADGGTPSLMDAPGFSMPPPPEPLHAGSIPPAAPPINLDSKPETAPAEAPGILDPGFVPPGRTKDALPPVPPKAVSATDSSIEDSFDALGFAPTFQDDPMPWRSDARNGKPDAPGISLAGGDDSRALRGEPQAAIPPSQPLKEPQSRTPSGQASLNMAGSTPEKREIFNSWTPESELSRADAPNAGAWSPPSGAGSAKSKTDDLMSEPPATARDPSGRESWGGAPALSGSAGNWGDEVPARPGVPASMPMTETWDVASFDNEALPAISDESNVMGGERHGEPRPAISYGLPSEAPPASPAPPVPAASRREESAPAPRPIQERANQTPPAPAPSGDKKTVEPGGTTVLIRYTCPKCKTQGMQAVDKVGTIVNCSNCGKAMRLVMKK